MKKITAITALLSVAISIACSSPDESKKTLEDAGYTRVQTTGYAPLSCGEDDAFSTGFEATNPRGKRVEGVVCCGLLKGCTIRH